MSSKRLYSGIWYPVGDVLAVAAVLHCKNCEYSVSESVKRIRPLSPGNCQLTYLTEKHDSSSVFWTVVQLPTPEISLLGRIDIFTRDTFFRIMPFVKNTSADFKNFPSELNRHLIYQYDVESFDFLITTFVGETIFRSDFIENMNNVHYILNQQIKANMKKGNKFIINNISVRYPDGSLHEGLSIDTLKVGDGRIEFFRE